jgi:uncharacterized protein (TIGR03435 family)
MIPEPCILAAMRGAVLITLALASTAASAQNVGPTTPVAAFEAASVKRNASGETRIRFETPPGRLNAVNVPLRFLIRQAYRVPEARIIGGPSWLDTDRFDIVATAQSGASGDAVREMLRALLKERFGLALHMETREMAIYELKVARTDGTLGPNLRRSSTDCTGRTSSVVAGQVQCGILVSQGPGSASLRGGAATLENFVRLFGDFLDRPLIDSTGLAGRFDLELQFTAPRSATPGAAVPGGLAAAANPDDVATVFTAVREQLGLALESRRGPAEIWAIDAASIPSLD